MLHLLRLPVVLLLTIALSNPLYASGPGRPDGQKPAPWAYDQGPDRDDPMGLELIDIVSRFAFLPGVSLEVMGSQKFRPDYGLLFWRMMTDKDAVKIMFFGQDATHQAEVAGRTATAGFGGRAQDLANYFGVDWYSSYSNAYLNTIAGQYGSFDAPYVYTDKSGKESVRFSGFVDSQLWMMTHDPQSPLPKTRNDYWDWMLRQNRNSLKLIVLFGGASRDSMASFIESKGGRVGTRHTVEEMRSIRVPVTKLTFAGGNNQFPMVLNSQGKDLYQDVLGRRPDYKNLKDQQAVREALQKGGKEAIDKMVFTEAGPFGNGLIHPGQLGGFDLNQIWINGVNTRSLKGLPLSDGTKVEQDVIVLELPHPTRLSMMSKQEAADTVGKALKVLDPYIARGWNIEPDAGFENKFAQRKPYAYSRAKIGPEYYDFGAPGNRMVGISDASRMPKNPHVIIFGSREKVEMDMERIQALTDTQPAEFVSTEEIYANRPRSEKLRYVYDSGPGEKYAELIKKSLDLNPIFQTKRGMSWEEDGINAYNVKTHPNVKDYGHYRGTFKKPRVLILADPDGYDEMITSRAMTGTRGQYLHGLMRDIGVGAQYLVIRTVPFGMDGAKSYEWNRVLAQTQTYRDRLIGRVLKENEFDLIITDGTYAKKEMNRILGESKTPVNISRRGLGNGFGIKAAGKKITSLPKFKNATVTGLMANIPREHLSFYARVWEGTSGDRVITASDANRGKVFASVVPGWAKDQVVELDEPTRQGVDALKTQTRLLGLPLPGESVPDFLSRKAQFLDSEAVRDKCAEALRLFEGLPKLDRGA